MHEQLIVANAFTPGAQAINKSLRNLDQKKKSSGTTYQPVTVTIVLKK